MKTPDMAKENNFVLREAVKAAQMGYFDHLSAGGKHDPAEERWIEALTAGADAITQVVVFESHLEQMENVIRLLKKENEAALVDLMLCNRCSVCEHYAVSVVDEPCKSCQPLEIAKDKNNFKWRGVCEENTKEKES